MLATALFLLGLAGRFTVGALAVVMIVALVFVAPALAGAGGWRPAAPKRLALAIAAGAGPVLLALYPPTAWDATIYHLPLARRLAETGALGLADNLRYPVFPLAAETLFGAGLLAGDGRAAQMVSAVATLATAALLAAWGRERLGASPLALLPAALWLGHPIVVYYAGTAYVEPLLALFTTAALHALDRGGHGAGRAAPLLAGAFVGWAAATKYLALPVAPLLALVALAAAPAGRRGRVAALFAGGFALAAGPFYAWIWATTGNPVFPFLPELFGASPWSVSDAAGLGLSERALGERLAAALRLPWDLVADRARVNLQPPYSPLLPLALVAAAWAAVRAPWTRPALAVVALHVALFGWLPADSRYLLAAVPALGLALAAAGERWLRRWPPAAARGAARALVLLALVTGPAYAALRIARSGPLPLDEVSTSAYLGRTLPLYRAVEAAHREAGAGAVLYGLHAERTIYWFQGRQLGDWNGPYRYGRVAPLLGRPWRLARQLDEFGADLLLVPAGDLAALASGPRLERHFRTLYRDEQALLLARRHEPAPPALP